MSKRDYMAQDEIEYQESILYKTIGSNIEKCMKSGRFTAKKRNVTQDDIASEFQKETGVKMDRSNVSRWISGTRHPSIMQIIALCKLFNCSFEYLCGIKEKKRDDEAAERFTGLSKESVHYLRGLKQRELAILDSILNHESGLDTILQNIIEAQDSARGTEISDLILDIIIPEYDYDKQMQLHNEFLDYIRLNYPKYKTFEEIPPFPKRYEVDSQDKFEKRIEHQLNVNLIHELRQEKAKRIIQRKIEDILERIIPSAKSKKYPNPVLLKQTILHQKADAADETYVSSHYTPKEYIENTCFPL